LTFYEAVNLKSVGRHASMIRCEFHNSVIYLEISGQGIPLGAFAKGAVGVDTLLAVAAQTAVAEKGEFRPGHMLSGESPG
jgi:hypothetical protein